MFGISVGRETQSVFVQLSSEQLTPIFKVQDYKPEMWDGMKDNILELNQIGFEHPYTEDGLYKLMHRQGVRVCLLRTGSDQRIIGVTCAYPERRPNTAHIAFTVLHPNYQRQGLVGKLYLLRITS